jgi:hypothetical protein
VIGALPFFFHVPNLEQNPAAKKRIPKDSLENVIGRVISEERGFLTLIKSKEV